MPTAEPCATRRTTKPPQPDGTLDELLRAVAADPEAGAWGRWAERLLADDQAATRPSNGGGA